MLNILPITLFAFNAHCAIDSIFSAVVTVHSPRSTLGETFMVPTFDFTPDKNAVDAHALSGVWLSIQYVFSETHVNTYRHSSNESMRRGEKKNCLFVFVLFSK